jgi:hypothetical protein
VIGALAPAAAAAAVARHCHLVGARYYAGGAQPRWGVLHAVQQLQRQHCQ